MPSGSTINYNFGGYLQSVPTLAALRSTSTSTLLNKGDTIQVTAGSASDDHGGGDFVWLPGETSADDNLLFIKPNDVAANQPGRWVLFGQAKALALEIGLQEVEAIVNDPVYGNLDLKALYDEEITLRASGDSALAQLIQQLQATVTSDVATLTADITDTQTSFASTTEAQAQTIQTLTATVNTNNSNTEAQITNEQTARADADSALSQTIQTLTATVNNNNSTTTASIQNEQTARADGDGALAQQITNLTATVNGNTASISDESTARANADGALSERISTLEANSSDGDSAEIQTLQQAVADLDGKTEAYWQATASVSNGNRAQLTVFANNNGAGVDIVGDVSIDGNLLVSGSVNSDQIANNAVTLSYAAANTNVLSGDETTTTPYDSVPGSGGASGGTVGGGGGGSGCPTTDSYMPDGGTAGEVVAGSPLMMLKADDNGYEPGEVQSVSFNTQPSYRITTESGITLCASASTPITTRGGVTVNIVHAGGLDVPVLDDGDFRWEAIVRVDYIGEREVAVIEANDGVYAAGEFSGRYIFTHNKQVNSE